MKQHLTIRSIALIFFSAILVSSCEKAELVEDLPEESCSTTFTGNVLACGEIRKAELRFVSEKDETVTIQGDLTYFKGNDATVTVSGATMTVIQSAADVSTSRQIRVTGPVTGCEEVVITVTWTSTNYDDVISSDWYVIGTEGTELATAVPSMVCDPRKAGK